MNPSMKTHFQVPSVNTQKNMETEVEAQVPLQRNHNFKNLFLNQVHSSREIFLHHNLEDIMIEETFQLELIIKILYLNLHGKFLFNLWIIITTFPSSLMDLGKNLIHTVLLQFQVPTICLTKEEIRSYLSFLNSLSPSKVKNY